MSRKIYDIVPPKVAHKIENAVKPVSAKEIKKRKNAKALKHPKKEISSPASRTNQLVMAKNKFPLKEVLTGGIVVVFLLGIYFASKLPKASVEISPQLEPITLQAQITADKSVTAINFQNKVIPLQILDETKEGSQVFPSTGIALNEGKAKGSIKIYNKVSPATPVTLVSGTHFLSDSGKYFVTLAKVTIPAMKGKTPGSVAVKIQAEQPGSDYNIKPSKFSAPKLSGTIYYYGIWGESTEEMNGGYTGKVKQVTKDDLDGAKDILTKKLLKDAEDSLKRRISQDEILLNGSIKSSSSDSDAKADSIADTFIQKASVKVQATVVKRKDFQEFAKQALAPQLPEGKILMEKSLNLNYSSTAVNFDKGTEKISLQISAERYDDIDLNNLADLFKRKTSDEIKDIINLQYGQKVAEVKISFWPFWVRKAPKDINRVKVNLNFK